MSKTLALLIVLEQHCQLLPRGIVAKAPRYSDRRRCHEAGQCHKDRCSHLSYSFDQIILCHRHQPSVICARLYARGTAQRIVATARP
jgi:hypothetical protein